MSNVIPNLVSTIIPVYNRPVMLRLAVTSVLNQAYRPIQIIVVDDGSTDDTLQVAHELQEKHPDLIKVATKENSGPGPTREAGRLLAEGEVLPALGRKTLNVALQEWPISFNNSLPISSDRPRGSFIFAHAGQARLPRLCQTIRSVFAQTDCVVEVIVVDQSDEPIFSQLPAGVSYRHLDKRNIPEGWHKSWAYNVGARLAKSDTFVFQDGDVCVPCRYAAEVHRTLSSGEFNVASLQRMLFYLNAKSTELVEANDSLNGRFVPERVYQNWKGGTIAVQRDAFFRIGRFDEGFVDWVVKTTNSMIAVVQRAIVVLVSCRLFSCRINPRQAASRTIIRIFLTSCRGE